MNQPPRRRANYSQTPRGPKRTNTILNVLIGVVVLLIAFTLFKLFASDEKETALDQEAVVQPEESGDPTPALNQPGEGEPGVAGQPSQGEPAVVTLPPAPGESPSDDGGASAQPAPAAPASPPRTAPAPSSGASSQPAAVNKPSARPAENKPAAPAQPAPAPNITKPQAPAPSPSPAEGDGQAAPDPKVEVQDPAAQPAAPEKKPTGGHVSSYDKNSADYKEKLNALSSASGIPQGNIIYERVQNGGGPQKSIGVVKSKDGKQKYKIHLEWVEGQGWVPTKKEAVQ